MTKANDRAATDLALSQIFKAMDAHQAQEIRDGYYKAVEGLMTLAEALGMADAKQTPSAGPLLVEQLYAVEALDAMKQSRLGAVSSGGGVEWGRYCSQRPQSTNQQTNAGHIAFFRAAISAPTMAERFRVSFSTGQCHH